MSHFSIIRRLLVLASLALILPTILPGQVHNYQSDSPSGQDGKPIVMPVPFSLEIRNGAIIDNGKPAGMATIGNLLDYLKKQGKAFNIILGPGVADLQISDLELNMPEFNNKAVFEAMAASVEDEVKSSTPSDSDPDFGIYRLSLHEDSARQTQVFNLTSYLNPDGKADDKTVQEKLASLTDIIYKTLHDVHPVDTDAVQPHYQFHQGANLLIVIAPPEALAIANQVVNALQPPDGNPRSQDMSDMQQMGDLAKYWAGVAAQLNSSGDSNNKDAELQDLYAKFRDLSQNKSMSIEQLADLQRKISDLMKQIQDTQIQQNLQQSPRDLPDKTTSP